jgi:hypothetical protein
LQPTTRNYACLFLSCLLFHLAGTWIVPLIDRDEPRFAEASREMLERGDYVVPYFNNAYRFDKPPFTYWAQAASYKIFGANDFAARFPSALAAALAALVIFAWGFRMGDERVGFWGAIIFTLSLQVVEHAKAAVADMWLVLFVTMAHWAGYELYFRSEKQRSTPNVQRSTFNEEHATPNSRWWWIFYIALALAFLAKGPIGWIPLATVALTKLFVRDKRAPRFSFINCGHRRAVGHSGINPHTRPILGDWHWPPCCWALVYGDGGTWGQVRWHLFTADSLLLRDCVLQFFPVVDKAAMVGEETAARARSNRHLSPLGCGHRFWNFHARDDETSALHPARLSVARALAGASFSAGTIQ